MKKQTLFFFLIAFISLFYFQCDKEDKIPETCSLLPDPGFCFAAIPRYYYDQEEQKCKEFTWGGCNGVVPFETLENCKAECGCKKVEPTLVCDTFTLVDNALYEEATAEGMTISHISIEEHCLEVTIVASGCDGETWGIQLIDSESIAESFPVQRFLRLSLNNIELCDAIIQKTYSFDLKPIQLESYSEIILNIDNWDASLSYLY